MPKDLELPVIGAGMKMEDFGRGADQSVHAAEVVKFVISLVAGGLAAPSYLMLGNLYTDAPSGVSLVIQATPMLSHRFRRKRINARSVEQIYNIERAQLVEAHGTNKYGFLRDVKQTWNPGTVALPEAEADRIARLIQMRDEDGIDHAEFLRLLHKFATDEEAIELHEKYKARKDIGGYGQAEDEEDPIAKLMKQQGKPDEEEPDEEETAEEQ